VKVRRAEEERKERKGGPKQVGRVTVSAPAGREEKEQSRMKKEKRGRTFYFLSPLKGEEKAETKEKPGAGGSSRRAVRH